MGAFKFLPHPLLARQIRKLNKGTCKVCLSNVSGIQENRRKKLVILGTGWGGYSLLRNINKKLFDVVVISPRNHFLFTPLLASTTVGTLEFRSIIEPVRNTHFRDEHHFQLAKAVELQPDRQVVVCQSVLNSQKYEVSYDMLVMAVGARSNTFNVPGVQENAFFLKEISHARAIRNRILTNFELSVHPKITPEEEKRLLHFVICGGGPTGVEFGAELYDFLREDVSRLYAHEKEKVQVTLLEPNQILPSFDHELRAFAERKIKQRPHFKLIQSSVVEVHDKYVKLQDGQVLPCGLVVWSTGLAPRPFLENSSLPKSKQGQLLVDSFLQVKGIADGSVYALGDCAHIEGAPLACTAQVAERQGRYLAKCLAQSFNSTQSLKPFSWNNMGMMAYVGDYQALAEFEKTKLHGFMTWLLWRSAYLTMLGSFRLRLQVPFDWLRTFVFGRDTSKF